MSKCHVQMFSYRQSPSLTFDNSFRQVLSLIHAVLVCSNKGCLGINRHFIALIWSRKEDLFIWTPCILDWPVVWLDYLLHFIAIYGIKNVVNCDVLSIYNKDI